MKDNINKKIDRLDSDLAKLREQLAKVKHSVSHEYTITSMKASSTTSAQQQGLQQPQKIMDLIDQDFFGESDLTMQRPKMTQYKSKKNQHKISSHSQIIDPFEEFQV